MVILAYNIIYLVVYAVLQNVFSNMLVGLYRSFEDGMIFHGIAEWTYKLLGDYWSKPISQCVSCMPSVYWILPNLLVFYVLPLNLLNFIPAIIISALALSHSATKKYVDVMKQIHSISS